MCFLDVVEHLKRAAKFIVHRVGAVADDFESTAFLGAFETERSDDDLTSRFQDALDLCDIFATVFGVGEEMKYCTIVPEVVGFRG